MGLRKGCGIVVFSIFTTGLIGCSSTPTVTKPPMAVSAVAPKPIYAMPYAPAPAPAVNRDLRVMTFNLRVSTFIDGMNNWAFRKGMVVERIRSFDPDLLGTQEGKDGQCDFLKEELSEYSFFGAGRNNGKSSGEFCG